MKTIVPLILSRGCAGSPGMPAEIEQVKLYEPHRSAAIPGTPDSRLAPALNI